MTQADQAVISLRPGGGGGIGGPRAGRLFPFGASTGSLDFLRPRGGASSGFAAKVRPLHLGMGAGGDGPRVRSSRKGTYGGGGGGLRGALRVMADGCDISLVFWFDTPL